MATSTANKRGSGSMKRTVKDQSGAGLIKIGDLLSKAGYITSNQFEHAKAEQKKSGRLLSLILLSNGYIEDQTVVNFLNRLHNYTSITIADKEPDPALLELLPYETAKQFIAFPVRQVGNTLQVTMAEPTNSAAVEELQDILGKSIDACVSSYQEIIEAYLKYYKIDEEEYKTFFLGEDDGEEEEEVTQVEDFGALVSDAADDFEIGSDEDEESAEMFSASDAPIIKLVNGILLKAVKDGVSDIHIEPFEKSMQVRYRKDGSLYKSMNLPLTIKNALAARMKILADLNITERRVPQDGRIQMRLGRNKAVDFRVSTLPLLHGEGIVLRILDKSSLNVDLTKLGFEVETFAALRRSLEAPQGLLLVTGPTGSGKTVTLYSALNSLNKEDTKILTAEDPVEFNFRGINQVNVNTEVGMTFPAALKAFLRQDPDIIMVGEIRDMSTAEIAIKAAMTGHLVFSTLHTNDAPATVGRLRDIGIPSYMLASSLTMVLAQRLGRRLCQKCKIPAQYDKKYLLEVGFTEEEVETELTLYQKKGCNICGGLGYKGRVGFFELLEVTEEVAQAINAEVPEEDLRKIATQEGMVPLRQAALIKVRQGITDISEALRCTVLHEDSLPSYLINPDIIRYNKGDVIIKEGNHDKDFFKLIHGQLYVIKDFKTKNSQGEIITKKQRVSEISEPGEFFGEMAAITGQPRDASIAAAGSCEVKRYPGDKLHDLIERYPDVALKLFKIMARRQSYATRMIAKMANKPGAPPGRPRQQQQMARQAQQAARATR